MPSRSYLTFLEASNKLWAGFTGNQREILLAVIKRDSSSPYRVRDIIGMRSIASQATLHKALAELVAQGYLVFKPCPSDNRVKFVSLARKGSALEARLTKILRQSCG